VFFIFLDVDEYTDGRAECQHDCINSPGSYVCICNGEYIMTDDGISCTGK